MGSMTAYQRADGEPIEVTTIRAGEKWRFKEEGHTFEVVARVSDGIFVYAQGWCPACRQVFCSHTEMGIEHDHRERVAKYEEQHREYKGLRLAEVLLATSTKKLPRRQ
jgi:hypothetical protein